MQDLTDEQLVEVYLKGDKKALEILISRYLKPIYNFVYKYVNNSHDAEDITQETFVKIWKNIKKFDREKKFKAWIYQVARNTMIDFFRKKKTIPFSRFEDVNGNNVIIETLTDLNPLPLEVFEKKDFAQRLVVAINQLSPKYRDVVLMRYKEQLTFREISKNLGEQLNTVKSRYRRGLIELRKILIEPQFS
ncbi:MAG: RNA polymerase sigma factor [Candidatus Paceibacterota bacterium]|jgi:RNA polymerase sigma-70 factor (ECF subfamily)